MPILTRTEYQLLKIEISLFEKLNLHTLEDRLLHERKKLIAKQYEEEHSLIKFK